MDSFEDILNKWEKGNYSEIIEKECDLENDFEINPKINNQIPVIDLHGLNRHEAIKKLSDFITSNQKSYEIKIKIIHGAGHHSKDGIVVLKQVIRSYLSHQEAVRYHRPGRIGEGSQGVTIAFIKQKS